MCRLIMILMLFFIPIAPVFAAQWAEVGDKQLREDVEILHDAGLLHGPVMSWPLPWEQIAEDAVQASTSDEISPFLQAAARRVVARYREHPRDGWHPHAELKLQATNGNTLVRDFSGGARSKADINARVENSWEDSTLVYGVGYQQNQTFEGTHYAPHVTLDNLYISQKIGNWIVFAGTVEEWWGPSGEQSLILSNAARPYPKFGFKRISTEAPDLPILRWIGPWRLETSVGVLNGPRNDYHNILIHSERLEVQPFRHFDLAISRYAQICGTGNPQGLPNRPCSASIFFKSLFLVGSANAGNSSDTSNSGAAIDLRYARPVGNVNFILFAQFYAEDSVFTSVSRMGGFSFAGHTEGFGSWKLGAEVADTRGLRYFQKGKPLLQPGSTYLNFIYTDGYSYRGQPIAASIDGDSNLVSLFGSVTDKRNRRWSGAIRYADINIFDTPTYRISRTREKILFAEGAVAVPTAWGDIDLKARVQSDTPNTPGRRVPRAQIEAGWTIRY